MQPVPVDDPGEVAYRLTHLAKYFNVLELSSPDAMSRLAGKLEVKLMRTPEEPFDEPGGIPTVDRDTNRSTTCASATCSSRMEGPPSDADWYIEELRRRTMNITVLNLAPDWSISRFLPPSDAEDYFDLEPGETLLLRAGGRASRGAAGSGFSRAAGATEAVDILKVFATTDTTSYDSLQLPALDEVASRASLVNPRRRSRNEPGSRRR